MTSGELIISSNSFPLTVFKSLSKKETRPAPIHIDSFDFYLTLPMLRLLSCKAQERKYFGKPSKPCHVGTHLKALTKYSQMSTHLPGFQSFFCVFAAFRISQTSHQQHKG